MQKPLLITAIGILLMISGCQERSSMYDYPQARQEPFDTIVHGIKLSDPWFWMSREVNQDEVIAFSMAQDSLFQMLMDRIPGDSLLMADMERLFDGFASDWAWYNMEIRGSRLFHIGGNEQGMGLMRGSLSGDGNRIIMPIVHTINGRNWRVRNFAIAYKNPWIAVMLIERGDANPHIRIWDYEKQAFLNDSLGRVMFNSSRGNSMAWLPDDSGLLYSRTPTEQLGHEREFNGRILLHRIGTSQENDIPVFGRGVIPAVHMEPYETPFIMSNPDSDLLIVYVNQGLEEPLAYYVNYQQINGAATPWHKVPGKIRWLRANQNYIYLITPDKNNYVLKRLQAGDPNNLETLMENHDLPLVGGEMAFTGNHVFVPGRKVGDMCLYQVNLDGNGFEKIALPVKGNVFDLIRLRKNEVLFSHSSPLHEAQPYLVNAATGNIKAWPHKLEKTDASHLLETQVLEVPSRDGQLIPVTMVYRKGLQMGAANRIWLQVYGSAAIARDFGTETVQFYPWFEREGIFTFAHVRGGGEKGEEWVRGGSIPYTENRINDFVDVSRFLIDNQYTAPERLVIDGTSAGTYTIGTVVNRHPELYALAIFQVGVPEGITTSTIADFRHSGRSEGVPVDAETARHLYALSPLYHVPKGKKLPAMLVTNGATDYAIPFHLAPRYIARLQQAQRGDKPILLHTAWDAGHSKLGFPQQLKYALWQTGHPDFQLSIEE
jgi:prolyl oligopeptidase